MLPLLSSSHEIKQPKYSPKWIRSKNEQKPNAKTYWTSDITMSMPKDALNPQTYKGADKNNYNRENCHKAAQ
jgi:hypothetical protein